MVILVVVAFVGLGGLGPNSPLAPRMVNVAGTITPSGEGTSATGIVFKDRSGAIYSAPATNDYFGLSLSNHAIYSIEVNWSGSYPWQHGTVNVSSPLQLSVGFRNGNPVYDPISLPTPTASIGVTGTASSTGSGTHALEIVFKGANDGVAYAAQVTNGTYTTDLPNEQNYSIQIQWSGPGSSGSCNATSLNLNAPPDTDTIQASPMSC